ncbi:MAG: DUF6056 family protein [Clostridium sp.]|nr:DUF6056 family protein [Clostridium sp.]
MKNINKGKIKSYQSLACILLLIVSMLPLLYIGRYNVLSADDYSMCKEMHHVIAEGGGIGDIISYAFSYVAKSYQTWIGCYSVSFLDVFNPGVFGEQFTFLTPVLMLGSILLFLYVTICCLIGFFYERDEKGSCRKERILIWAVLSFLMIETMPSPAEAFYWYAGAIAYTTLHYLMFVFIALQIWSAKLAKRKTKVIYAVFVSLLALILGGSQYTTGLLAVIGTVFLFAAVNKRGKWQQAVPGIFLLVGFGVSMLAPGNGMRQTGTGGMAPVRAILYSFVQALRYGKEWIRPLAVLAVLFLLPAMYGLVKKSKGKYRYPLPGVVWFFSFCIFAAGFAPSLYGVGNVDSGRIQNQLQSMFYILLFADIFYGIGWLIRKTEEGKREVYRDIRTVISVLGKYAEALQGICLVLMLLVFVGTSDKNTFSSLSALRSLANGEAKTYYTEAQERLVDYKNPDVTVVEAETFSVKPHVLYFTDIVEEGEPNYWINENIAAYYGKEKVILRKLQ